MNIKLKSVELDSQKGESLQVYLLGDENMIMVFLGSYVVNHQKCLLINIFFSKDNGINKITYKTLEAIIHHSTNPNSSPLIMVLKK